MIFQYQSCGSYSKPQRSKPRLKRALKRDTFSRLLATDDIKYIYAAYKKGIIPFQEGITPSEFTDCMMETFSSNYHWVWVLGAKEKIVGLVFGVELGPFIFLGDTIFFPWASSRNKIECWLRFIVDHRDKGAFMGYCKPEDKKFFELLCRYGVGRRVGTMDNNGQPFPLFQFIRKK